MPNHKPNIAAYTCNPCYWGGGDGWASLASGWVGDPVLREELESDREHLLSCPLGMYSTYTCTLQFGLVLQNPWWLYFPQILSLLSWLWHRQHLPSIFKALELGSNTTPKQKRYRHKFVVTNLRPTWTTLSQKKKKQQQQPKPSRSWRTGSAFKNTSALAEDLILVLNTYMWPTATCKSRA